MRGRPSLSVMSKAACQTWPVALPVAPPLVPDRSHRVSIQLFPALGNKQLLWHHARQQSSTLPHGSMSCVQQALGMQHIAQQPCLPDAFGLHAAFGPECCIIY